MKKKYLLILILSSTLGISQEVEKKSIFDRKHEVKFGSIKMLAGTIFEGTYEYIHSKDFTYGSSILVNLDKENDYLEDFSVTPFARFYFQESKEYGAKGFFVEGFVKYASGKNFSPYDYVNYDEYGNLVSYEHKLKYNAASLGLALGKKWINSSGFVFEILGGISRNIGNSSNTPDVLFRGDLNIGYRF